MKAPGKGKGSMDIPTAPSAPSKGKGSIAGTVAAAYVALSNECIDNEDYEFLSWNGDVVGCWWILQSMKVPLSTVRNIIVVMKSLRQIAVQLV